MHNKPYLILCKNNDIQVSKLNPFKQPSCLKKETRHFFYHSKSNTLSNQQGESYKKTCRKLFMNLFHTY